MKFITNFKWISKTKNRYLSLLLTILLLLFSFPPLLVMAEENQTQNTEPLEKEKQNNKEESDTNIINPSDPSVLKGYISKVPSGTKLKIIIEAPIDEETSKIDDEVIAKTSEDIIVDGNIVVPVGSTVIGTISEINLAKRLHKAGSVRIEFKSLTTPDGRQIPIVASVLTHSGLLKGKYNKKTALISTATIVTPIAAGLGAGLATEGSAVGAGIGATLGALAGLALFFFQRGNMVDIKAGDELNIELTEEALIPKVASKDIKELDLEKNSLQDENRMKSDSIETDFSESPHNKN